MLITRLRYPRSSMTATLSRALSTRPSAVTPPYLARISFSREPEFTPTRIGIPRSAALSTTALMRSLEPIFPGLMRILSAPFSMAATASR